MGHIVQQNITPAPEKLNEELFEFPKSKSARHPSEISSIKSPRFELREISIALVGQPPKKVEPGKAINYRQLA